MFRRLHHRLLLICTAGTAAVLITMSLAALFFSLSHLRLQHTEAFQSNLNAVFYYLQAQPVVDHAWLSRTEADGGLLIDIRMGEQPLRYTGQSAQRELLCAHALAMAQEYGYDPALQPSGLEPTVVSFQLAAEGRSFRAAAASLPYRDHWLNVILLKDRSGELAAVRRLCIAFGVITVAATALLAVFSYHFTGRAIRPVKESLEKQREFVSAASHELRSPLSVIRVGIGLLKTKPEQVEKLAEQMDGECAMLARLVDDLLLLARADDGRWSLNRKEESPKTLLLTAYERFETRARAKDIRLDIVMEGELPPRLFCDGERVVQVLSILLDNALEYTPQGGRIRLCLSASGNLVAYVVEDDGPGIPPADRLQVFQRFYRGDPSRSSAAHHGLGLSIAKEIAALHGGEISLADSEMGGARFTCTFPR